MRKDLFLYTMTGGSASSIRKIAVFGSTEDFGYEYDSPIRILHILPRSERNAEELTHRDYLGSLMALGIDRSLTGDILVRGKEAYVYVLSPILSFLCENLPAVRHTLVICRECSANIPELEIQFQPLSANIASERLDLILSALTGLKREDAKKFLSEKKVFVNGRLKDSPGQKIEAGDEITIRGYGKYLYDGSNGQSRKGRIFINARKYI